MLVRSPDGTRLFVQVSGPEDAPVVVLVHGLGLSTQSWTDVVTRLSEYHRVVAYDLRGHGRSDPPASNDYSLGAQAADLDAVLSTVLGDAGSAVVVGHSLGGEVLLARAARSLDGIRGAVFVASAGSVVTVAGLPGRRLPRPLRRVVRDSWLGLLVAAARLTRGLRHAEWLTRLAARRLVFGPGAPEPAVQQAYRDFLDTNAEVLARTTFVSVRSDGSRLAPQLRVPTLVLHGDHDKEIGQDDVATLLSRLPDAHLITLPGTGHMLPLTQPQAVAQHVTGWVRRVAQTHAG